MANTMVNDGKTCTLTALDGDWKWNDAKSDKGWGADCAFVKLESISFRPGAASERCIIRNGSLTTGPVIFDTGVCAGTSDARLQYFEGDQLCPVLAFADGTYANSASMVIIRVK